MRFKLGVKLKDKVSKAEGICVSRTEFLNGCIRYTIQPPVNKKDKTLPNELWFDESQLEEINEGVSKEIVQRNTGGPTTQSPPKGLKN